MIPIHPIYLFADSQLLFWTPPGQDKPFIQQIREGFGDKCDLKAAYVGASNNDQPEYFSIFEGAMQSIGITDCRMIFADYQAEDQRYLKDADIILLAGGDAVRGWRAIVQTGMDQDILNQYYNQTVLIGISAGAVQLGLMGWEEEKPEEDDLFDGFKLIPYVMDAHDEAAGWRRLQRTLKASDEPVKGLGLPSGGGMIYHPDHAIEPVRTSIVEFTIQDDEMRQMLLFPENDALA